MEKRYTVTQASGMLEVKSYVLRYWEEELELRIRRNEQGHRYYTDYDLRLFANIKELKNRGLQLRAIKELIPRISRTAPGSAESKSRLLPAASEAVEAPEMSGEAELDEEECKILEFQQILERLIAQEIQMKREGEVQCRNLDAAIRRQQQARKEAAAASCVKQSGRLFYRTHEEKKSRSR